MTALIDCSAQLSNISSRYCDLLALEVHPLGRLLELEGTGGSSIPYLGYVDVNLQIPGIKGYSEDVLLLVILTMTYSEKILVVLRSKIIDWAMGVMTKGELMRETVTWKQAYFCAVMFGSLQLPCTNSKEDGEVGRKSLPPKAAIQQHPGVSARMTFRDLFVPPRRLPFPHLGWLASMSTQVSRDTACRSTCLLNLHEASSHLPLWFQLLPMGNCTQGPLEYRSATET